MEPVAYSKCPIYFTLNSQTAVMHDLKMLTVVFRENEERNHIFLNLPLTSVIKVLISFIT